MGACKTCGEKAGLGRDQCTTCKERVDAAAQRAADEAAEAQRLKEQQEAVEAARQLEERTLDYIEQTLLHIRRALAEGLRPSLFIVETLTTTYALNGAMQGAPPDLTKLAVYAANGWEVVATIPQTEGTGLTNRLGNGGTVWAAGIGGMVTGTYLLLRLPVTSSYLDSHEDYVRSAIRTYYVDGVSSGLLGAAFAAPVLEQGRNGMSTLANVGLGIAGGMLLADSIGTMMGDSGDGGYDGGDSGGGDFGGFEF